MKIEFEVTPRLQRFFLGAIVTSILSAGAAAYAQTATTPGATTTDTLVGSALYTLGNAVTALRAEVAILQTSERVARATISSNGGVLGSTWLSRVDHPSAGTYVVTFAPGVFASVPTCVTTANPARDAPAPTLVCYDVTMSSMTCQATVLGKSSPPAPVPVDTGISLVCTGS